MRNADRRLGKLSGVLTARERAVLVLESWKAGEPEDPSWRWTMPREQTLVFNALIELMNGVNVHLCPLLVVLCLEAEKLRLRLGLLSLAALWYVQAADAEWLVGQECPKAALSKTTFAHIPRVPVIHLTEELRRLIPEEEPTVIDQAIATVKERVVGDLQEQLGYLRAVEEAVEEVGEEFGGADPALPKTRELLTLAHDLLHEVRKEAERFVGPLDEVELADEEQTRVRRLVGLDE